VTYYIKETKKSYKKAWMHSKDFSNLIVIANVLSGILTRKNIFQIVRKEALLLIWICLTKNCPFWRSKENHEN